MIKDETNGRSVPKIKSTFDRMGELFIKEKIIQRKDLSFKIDVIFDRDDLDFSRIA